MMKYLQTLLATACVAALTAPVVQAAQRVTLDDGRQVELNDDFTWHYVQPAAPAKPKPAAENRTETSPVTTAAPAAAAAPLIAAPLVPRQRGTLVEVGSTKPTLQLSQSGVDIVLGSARYEDGHLIIPTAITNQSLQSVISIALNVELMDEQGKVLSHDSATIWQSIKRMAETYLRPQTAVAGKELKLATDQAERYQIRVSVENLQTR
ncbi:DUF3157 family protein [Vibrio sp. ABG19]|uniref:DUF3157 family protein n=1 Tax=Vibrio sp. ABG19 TaxID=2817385 RepID=UPI0032B76964